MKFEADEVSLSGGVRHGISQGGPVAIRVANSEWPKWDVVMSPDPVSEEELTGGRATPLTRPRPGHADLAGMQKYGFDDSRPVLERASARETAARVALGAVARAFLRSMGIDVLSHTVAIGPVSVPEGAPIPRYADVERLDEDPLRCWHEETAALMVAEVDQAHKDGDTLGGVVEVVVHGLPPGLGSYVHWDRRLDSRLAGALMGIQAIKGVEVGDGFTTTTRRGSEAHDEIVAGADGVMRLSERAGGIEGGMSTGGVLRVRAGMKPISTVPRALRTIDTSTGGEAVAHHQRSDVCAVPAAGVVAEAMVMLVIAQAVLEKFGGDSLAEVIRNRDSFMASIPDTIAPAPS
jgi:chorismate synthase